MSPIVLSIAPSIVPSSLPSRRAAAVHGCLLALLLALSAQSAPANDAPAGNSSGNFAQLELVTPAGPQPALELSTEVRTEITGLMARTLVRQRFRNPTEGWVEGRYQYPLPDGSAVEALRIELGERRIEGEIRARADARTRFEQARHAGRSAGLVEQHRPGLFTTDVTNIGPGETVVVEIEFGHRVDYRHGRFSLRLPMTVLPRYPNGADPVGARPGGHLPASPRYAEQPPHPLALTIDLRAGPELATLDSLHHDVDLEPRDDGGWTVELAEGRPVLDRDFELEWTLMERDRLTGALYLEEFEQRTHALLMLVPPADFGPIQRRREQILVIDASGSMQGTAIEQARTALSASLDRLQPGDRFNIIAFNSAATPLFDRPEPVGPATRSAGRRFIERLDADGGTEMDAALRLALADPPADGRLRQIVFATDGAISREQNVLDRVRRDLGDSRLFTIGIGHGVNAPFLRALAREGRGTHIRVNDPQRLARDVSELMEQLERPALERPALDWPVPDEAWPVLLPDLYAGEALMVVTRLDAPIDALHGEFVRLRAERVDRPVEHTWSLDAFDVADGVAREWARRSVQGVLDFARDDQDAEGLRAHALQIALDYQVLTPLTSLVAVDRTPRRSAHAALQSAESGYHRPHGRTLALPQTATSATRSIVAGAVALGLALLLLAAPRFQRAPNAAVGR